MENTELSLRVSGLPSRALPTQLYRGAQTGHIPSRQAGRGTGGHRGGTASGEPACCCKVQWPQGMDRRLLSDLAMLVEGGASPGFRLLPAPAARHGSWHRAGWDFGSWGSTPTICPTGSSIRATVKGGQEGC